MSEPSDDLQTVRRLIVDQIRQLIDGHDRSLNEIERDMGRHYMWLRRKLRGDRPLTVADLDELLSHLRVSPGAFLAEAARRAKKGRSSDGHP